MSNLTVYFIVNLNSNFQHEPTHFFSVNIANFLTHIFVSLPCYDCPKSAHKIFVSVPLTFLTSENCAFPVYYIASSGNSVMQQDATI